MPHPKSLSKGEGFLEILAKYSSFALKRARLFWYGEN